MSDKKKAYLRLLPVAVLFTALCIAAWIKAPADTSLRVTINQKGLREQDVI